jgi:Rhodopirellula transposase DDE domain
VDADQTIAQKWVTLAPLLNERQRRLWAGVEARAYGRGGIALVARATGMSRSTVGHGLAELDIGVEVGDWVRRPGAGRKPLIDLDPDLLVALDDLVEPTARGDPMSPLRWTAKSVRRLAAELTAQGHPVSFSKVGQLLRAMGYSLQAPVKENEGAQHADRDGQFHHINEQAKAHLEGGEPVISADTKKKLRHEVARSERTRRSEDRPMPDA